MEARNRPTLHWLVFAVASLAIIVLLVVDWRRPGDPTAFRNAVVAFVILGAIAEAGFLRVGTTGNASSVAFIPILSGVILFPTGWAIFVGAATMLVGEAVIRHKPLIKTVYNVSTEVLTVAGAAWTYDVAGGEASLTTFAPSATGFLAASVVYFLANQGTTVFAIALSTGNSVRESWHGLVGGSLLFDLVTGPVAILLTWLYVKLDLIGVLIVIVPLFVVRHLYQINLKLGEVNGDLLHLMVKAIEARDPYTSGHSVRVSKIAKVMARESGFSAKDVEAIATAALLHDVGKIYQEFATLLRKDGRLLPHEQGMMQTHPVRSAELVGTISTMRGTVEKAVRHHHERYDGCGYPDGLAGSEIPIGSRIIAIADTVDAMSTNRSYRQAMPYEKVRHELHGNAGTQFDPELVELFASQRVQAVVEAHLAPAKPFRPKTVAETFQDLRKAFNQAPGGMMGTASRWQQRRTNESFDQ